MPENSVKVVGTITRDVLPGDAVWFGVSGGYGKPTRAMQGIVLDRDTPEGEWDVNASGTVIRVKHRQIWAMVEGDGE